MRGAPRASLCLRVVDRIIPADAGSTRPAFICQALVGDHPRGCGEHEIPVLGELGIPGSSPRMRGAPEVAIEYVSHGRIIPADAGSTSSRTWPAGPPRDHPRGCGEHAVHRRSWKLASGSSPRMRGALVLPEHAQADTRIIPADAGSTLHVLGVCSAWADHPRGCGEHGLSGLGSRLAAGSSPRMRGARPQQR